MKVLAIVLLCAFAAVQGQSAVQVIDNSSAKVELEIKPWLVHLRVAVGTSGFLKTALGSLISENWILTGSPTVQDVRFIWISYGFLNVIQPSLVHESSVVRSQGPIGLVNNNRALEISATIAPISLALWSGDLDGVSCGLGRSASDRPGENVQCSEINLEESDDGKLIGDSNIFSENDAGTGLVNENGSLSALLEAVNGTTSVYIVFGTDELEYIESETGVAPQPQPATSEFEEEFRVKFVNL